MYINVFFVARILIIDWDVHHGQATQQMFYDDPRYIHCIYCTVSSSLAYDTQGKHMIIIVIVAFGIVYNNLWYIYHLAASIMILDIFTTLKYIL